MAARNTSHIHQGIAYFDRAGIDVGAGVGTGVGVGADVGAVVGAVVCVVVGAGAGVVVGAGAGAVVGAGTVDGAGVEPGAIYFSEPSVCSLGINPVMSIQAKKTLTLASITFPITV